MALKETSLHALHAELGARFTPFAGYDMPVMYGSILEEHEAVRERAGLFDVSHMGNLWVPMGQGDALTGAVMADVRNIPEGGSKYSAILRKDGTIVDDLYVFRTPWGYHVVPNAGMTETVVGLVEERGVADVEVDTDARCILALQGPRAMEVARQVLGDAVEDLGRFKLHPLPGYDERAFVSRTGYTGEDGVEIYVARDEGPRLFRALLTAGEAVGIAPCGLGARDTLRLEKGFALASHEFEGGRTPLEANLGRLVAWDHPFVGRDALEIQRAAGDHDVLVGLRLTERGIPRPGNPVVVDGEEVGVVTSGTMSPTLREGIALAYVPPAHSKVDTPLTVLVRQRPATAEVAALPFV